MQVSLHRRARRPSAARRVRALLGGVAVVAMLAGCAAAGPIAAERTMPAAAGTSSSSMVSSAPLETAQSATKVPVYWLGHSGSEVYLYREFLPSASDADPIEAALAAMTGQKPLDPDYFSPWKQPSRLGASISGNNLITVDISADAFTANVDQGIAERAIAQLVYTASAAAAAAGLIDGNIGVQVSILVDGHTNYNAFGKVVLDKPLTRSAAFVAPVWIVDPQNGTSPDAPLTVTGQGISNTGKLAWKLLKLGAPGSTAAPENYLSGDVAIGAGPNTLGKFAFTIKPPAGRYELQLYTVDPTGAAKVLGLDSKVIDVS
ncbi:GerMN domain-containing protein [Pseudarthrobacter sp. P1]|uniref:GerMN domain-containing protein n=1 Tax=Pseudarthrobacter sp. P1 TaxID=3418418 RepID=UPI003CEE0050